MLLAARPDLTWIVLGGLLVIILFFVSAIQDMMTQSTASPQARRDFMQNAVGLTLTAALLGYLLPGAIDDLETDDSETRILTIDSGETYTVESGKTETWLAVYDNGLLNINGSMDLEG